MRKDIEKLVQMCEVCQQNKYQALKSVGLLHPLPIPVQVWEEVSIDFLGGLPTSKGKDTIMVVVDRLTKSAHFISLHHLYSAKDVAEAFISEVRSIQLIIYKLTSQEGTTIQEIDQLLKERDDILEELKMKLFRAQNCMKDVELTVGEMVYLKAQPYKLKSLAHCPNKKLSPRFNGPFVVEEIFGKVAYKVKLPDHARIHPIFHVSQLKKAIAATVPCQ
ncbi:Tf2-11, partial [Mucuna pruriens]